MASWLIVLSVVLLACTPSAGPITVDDLPSLLIQPGEGPPGMSIVSDASAPAPVDTFTQGNALLADRFTALGLKEARAVILASDDSQMGSAGLIWPDENQAHEAFEAHAEALPELVVDFAEVPATELGAESRCGTFDQGPFGTAGAVCLYRVANATFFSPASGPSLSIDDVVAVARAVADRAQTLAS